MASLQISSDLLVKTVHHLADAQEEGELCQEEGETEIAVDGAPVILTCRTVVSTVNLHTKPPLVCLSQHLLVSAERLTRGSAVALALRKVEKTAMQAARLRMLSPQPSLVSSPSTACITRFWEKLRGRSCQYWWRGWEFSIIIKICLLSIVSDLVVVPPAGHAPDIHQHREVGEVVAAARRLRYSCGTTQHGRAENLGGAGEGGDGVAAVPGPARLQKVPVDTAGGRAGRRGHQAGNPGVGIKAF